MPSIPSVARSIPDLPELTNEALEIARWNPEVGCLVDKIHPGSPLIISFSFVNYESLPIFDFFGRTKKLELRAGLMFNRLLVRDARNAWYHRGVPGLGSHVDEVVTSLRGLIRTIRPNRVITIGQSMGGYAAIMFGMLLNVDRIIAFGALSHLDVGEATCYGDLRFLGAMKALAADRPKSGYYDLARLGDETGYSNGLHLIFGTSPGSDDGVSGNLDAIHSLRMSRLSNVALHPYPGSEHAVVKWLVEHGKIDGLLAGLLTDDGIQVREGG